MFWAEIQNNNNNKNNNNNVYPCKPQFYYINISWWLLSAQDFVEFQADLTRAGSRMISDGVWVDLIKLPYLLYVFGKAGLSKQYRPKSNVAEGVHR